MDNLFTKYQKEARLPVSTNLDAIITSVRQGTTADGAPAEMLVVEFTFPEYQSTGFHNIYFRDRMTDLVIWARNLVPNLKEVDVRYVAQQEKLDINEVRTAYKQYLVEQLLTATGKPATLHYKLNTYFTKLGEQKTTPQWRPYPISESANPAEAELE